MNKVEYIKQNYENSFTFNVEGIELTALINIKDNIIILMNYEEEKYFDIELDGDGEGFSVDLHCCS